MGEKKKKEKKNGWKIYRDIIQKNFFFFDIIFDAPFSPRYVVLNS